MVIKQLTEEYRPAVLGFMREFYSSDAVYTNGSEEIFNNSIDECIGNSPFLSGYVFLEGDISVGYAMLAHSFCTEFGRSCVWLEDIFIDSAYRKRGFTSEFIAFVKKKYPCSVLRLEVEDYNLDALSVYKRSGFEEFPYSEMFLKNY